MVVRRIRLRDRVQLPICPVCNEQVELENTKTDEAGHAIHEDCYLKQLRQREGKKEIKAS